MKFHQIFTENIMERVREHKDDAFWRHSDPLLPAYLAVDALENNSSHFRRMCM